MQMKFKSLNELNQEFQTEITETAEVTAKTAKPEITELKSLDELNLEFQAETMTELHNEVPERFEPINEISPISPINPIEFINPIESLEFINPSVMEIEEIEETEEIEEIGDIKKNRRFRKNKKEKRSIFALVSDMLFYLAILMVLFSALTYAPGNGNGSPRMFLGYSYFTVLTPSMQDEIPKGSFILVKETDPRELNIGDNITFMKDANTSVTHKIADIYENYENSGARGFQTKGVNNVNPDRDIVYESNIVGKVILVIPAAGAVISYLRAHIYIVFIIFGLCVILSFLLRGLFTRYSGNCDSDSNPDSNYDDFSGCGFDGESSDKKNNKNKFERIETEKAAEKF